LTFPADGLEGAAPEARDGVLQGPFADPLHASGQVGSSRRDSVGRQRRVHGGAALRPDAVHQRSVQLERAGVLRGGRGQRVGPLHRIDLSER
jgi:hypothetical protein